MFLPGSKNLKKGRLFPFSITCAFKQNLPSYEIDYDSFAHWERKWLIYSELVKSISLNKVYIYNMVLEICLSIMVVKSLHILCAILRWSSQLLNIYQSSICITFIIWSAFIKLRHKDVQYASIKTTSG